MRIKILLILISIVIAGGVAAQDTKYQQRRIDSLTGLAYQHMLNREYAQADKLIDEGCEVNKTCWRNNMNVSFNAPVMNAMKAYCLLYNGEIQDAASMYFSYIISNHTRQNSYRFQLPEKSIADAKKFAYSKKANKTLAVSMMLMLANSSNNPCANDPKFHDKLCQAMLDVVNGHNLSVLYTDNEIKYALLLNTYQHSNGSAQYREILENLVEYSCKAVEPYLRFYKNNLHYIDRMYSGAISYSKILNDEFWEMYSHTHYLEFKIRLNQLEDAIEYADSLLGISFDEVLSMSFRPMLIEQKAIASEKLSLMPEAVSLYSQAGDEYERQDRIEDAGRCYGYCYNILDANKLDNTQRDYFGEKAVRYLEAMLEGYPLIKTKDLTMYTFVLTNYYCQQKDTNRAIELTERLLDIHELQQEADFNRQNDKKKKERNDLEELLGMADNLLDNFSSRNNARVIAYMTLGSNDEAAQMFLNNKIYVRNPEIIVNLADKLMDTDQETASKLYAMAIDLYNMTPEYMNHDYIKTLIGYGDACFCRKNYHEAYNNYHKAMMELPQYYPPINDLTPGLITRMAFAQVAQKPEFDIQSQLIQASEHMAQASINSLGYTSQASFEALWDNCNILFSEVLAGASFVRNPTPEFQEKLFNSVMFQKNMFYISQKALYIAGNENPESRETFRKIASIRRTLENPDPSLSKLILDSLYNTSVEMEQSLIRESQLLKGLKDNMRMGFKEIRETLKPGEIAVEFAKVQLYRPHIQKALPHLCTYDYYAFVFGHDSQAPIIIKLFSEQELEEFTINAYDDENGDYDYTLASFLYSRNHYTISPTYQSKEFTNFIWGKVVEQFPNAKTIYFSPDGLLHTIGLEYLSIGNGKCMNDKYKMVRLSHIGKINSVAHSDYKFNTMLLYGGINYTLKDTARINSIIADTTRSLHSTRQFAKSNAPINYLPGTLSEANKIEKVFGSKIDTLKYYNGDNALEETFKEYAPSANLVHVATHGVFFEDEASTKKRSRDILEQGALIFAGSAKQNNRPAYIDDGFLTGLEISELNLNQNKLVVLSACETGLGHVNSNGFFGLERAFKIAGSKTIVMSHWTIDDNASYLLMSELYSNMSRGMDPRQALKEATKILRKNPKYTAPYFWAPFVIID